MGHIQARIVLRQVGIAAVAENALHEIEIADQAARRDEPDFHGLRRFSRRRPDKPAAAAAAKRSSARLLPDPP